MDGKKNEVTFEITHFSVSPPSSPSLISSGTPPNPTISLFRRLSESYNNSQSSLVNTPTREPPQPPLLLLDTTSLCPPAPTNLELFDKKEGYLRRWNGSEGERVFCVVTHGMFMEFVESEDKGKGGGNGLKQRKVFHLFESPLRLENQELSFSLFFQGEFMVFITDTYIELVEWVATLRRWCAYDERFVNWKKDDVLEKISQPAIFFSFSGVILNLNEQAASLLGYERRQLIGNSVICLLPSHVKRTLAEIQDSFFSTKKQNNFEIKLQNQVTALFGVFTEIYAPEMHGDIQGEMLYLTRFFLPGTQEEAGKVTPTSTPRKSLEGKGTPTSTPRKGSDGKVTPSSTPRKGSDGKVTPSSTPRGSKGAKEGGREVKKWVRRDMDWTLGKSQENILGSVQDFVQAEMREHFDEVVGDVAECMFWSASEEMERLRREERRLEEEIKRAKRKNAKLLRQQQRRERHNIKSSGNLPLQPTQRKISMKNVELNERLAADGGSGASVYVCTIDDSWQCVVKELNLSGIGSDVVAKFESEILLLESLPKHRNLVRYLFHDRTKTTFRLFMTRYHSTLANHLSKLSPNHQEEGEGNFPPPLSFQTCVQIGLDVATGVNILHQTNIVHRDLKTDNIFVSLNERRELACCSIGDMDIAKKLGKGVKAKTCIGTPGYMAPEIFSGTDYSFPCDVWSFGVVLYEVLSAGREEAPTFLSQKDFEKIAKTGQLPFQMEPEYGPLVKLMSKCLKKAPRKRPKASELQQALSAQALSNK